MNPTPTTDPELLGLLREISADPKSRLMKLATQGFDRRVPLHEAPISEGEPFLTRAERHLLTEHREQVGQWLFEAAKRQYLGAPKRITCTYHHAQSGWGPVQSLERLEESRNTLVRARNAAAMEVPWNVNLASEARESPLELAIASLRVAPRDSVRNLIGHAAFFSGRRDDGHRAWEEILAHRPSPWYRSVAEQNTAFRLSEVGRVDESKLRYRAAHVSYESRVEPLVGLLSCSLLSSDAEGARFASLLISELPRDATEVCVREHLEIITPRLGVGPFERRRGQVDWLRAIAKSLPQVGGEIAFAYLEHGGEK
jgi:hypothetical protein